MSSQECIFYALPARAGDQQNAGCMQIRVLHTPLICKALINCHKATVADHSLKMTRFLTSDTEKGAVVASLDTSGLLAITAFIAPVLEAGEHYQKLAQRATVKLQFEDGCMADAQAKVDRGLPVALVEVGAGHVYVALNTRLLCVDVEEVMAQEVAQGGTVQVGGADVPLPPGVALVCAPCCRCTDLQMCKA